MLQTYIAYLFLLIGSIFLLLAALGLLRMPNFLLKMQATSKASTLGVLLMSIGTALMHPTLEVWIKVLIICLLLFVTAPLATHALSLASKYKRSTLPKRD